MSFTPFSPAFPGACITLGPFCHVCFPPVTRGRSTPSHLQPSQTLSLWCLELRAGVGLGSEVGPFVEGHLVLIFFPHYFLLIGRSYASLDAIWTDSLWRAPPPPPPLVTASSPCPPMLIGCRPPFPLCLWFPLDPWLNGLSIPCSEPPSPVIYVGRILLFWLCSTLGLLNPRSLCRLSAVHLLSPIFSGGYLDTPFLKGYL